MTYGVWWHFSELNDEVDKPNRVRDGVEYAVNKLEKYTSHL